MASKISFQEIKSKGVDLLVIAGEASGDEHASILVGELKIRFPQLRIFALGGPRLEESGAVLVFDLVDHAVVGIFEVLKNYLFFRRLLHETISWIDDNRPKLILLVDFPGFNLRLAEALRRKGISRMGGGQVCVLQYISPQLWAWKANRRFKMERILDGVGVIFPFEIACYNDVDLPVSFVGHPFAASSYKSSVYFDEEGPLLLLPGSRVQPIRRILPVFLDAYEKLRLKFPNLSAVLAVPNEKINELVTSMLDDRGQIKQFVEVRVASKDLKARVALMSSGTMSLASALAGIPGVIAYRAHPLTYFFGKLLVKVPYLGMANLLIPEKPPYLELIQGKAQADTLSKEVERLLLDPDARRHCQDSSEKLRKLLSQSMERGTMDWLTQEGAFL